MGRRLFLGNSNLEFAVEFYRFLFSCIVFVFRLLWRLFLRVMRWLAGHFSAVLQ